MKFLILACLVVLAFADYGYYNVESYCSSVPCPRLQSEQGTTMACPLNGPNNAYWTRDTSYNTVLTVQTYNMWPLPDASVTINFNPYSQWMAGLNAVIVPTYTYGYYYYMLPCSVTFTDY